jgi:macrolide transport system ATP-binding/permease protein
MDNLFQDLRHAVRQLRRNPGATLLVIFALSLGIGANTSIFSLVNGVLLRPLPGVSNPESLVTLERVQDSKVQFNFAYPDYVDYRDNTASLAGLAAHCGTPLSFSNTQSERLRGDLVSGNYFSLLGVSPELGRLITPDDDGQPGANPVAVLSHPFWQRAFGGNRDVVGDKITLNGYPFTIIGVASSAFTGTQIGSSYDVWIPIKMQAQAMPRTLGRTWFNDRSACWISLFGRIKPAASIGEAQAQLTSVADNLQQNYPQSNAGRGATIFAGLGFDSDDRASLQSFLLLLSAAVMILLLIACTNVSNLLILRAAARRREIAIRLAVGASRGRLIRLLLTEGAMLSLFAGAIGILIAPWAARLILTFQEPAYGLKNVNLDIDGRIIAFTALVSVLTGIGFSLAPAIQGSKIDLVSALKDGAPGSGTGSSKLRRTLVVAQVALSLVLLIASGLAVKTMRRALIQDRGFDSQNLLLVSMDLSIASYGQVQGQSFYRELLRRVDALPGVVSSSLAKTVPPNSWSDGVAVYLPGQEPASDIPTSRVAGLRVDQNRIAPRYFETLGIPVLEGREFNDDDDSRTALVGIVNEKLANRLWPGETAVGKMLVVPAGRERRPPVRIIGVVRDTKHRSLLREMPMLVYVPELQDYDGRATLVARTTGDAALVSSSIREVFSSIDKNVSPFALKTMAEQIDSTLWQQRMAAGLIGAFGLVALLMSALGIYGVIAQSVSQRTREIGLRIALGADPRSVVKLILGQGFVLAVIGIICGLAMSFMFTRFMSSILYDVSATDPFAFVSASIGLLGVALGACLVPARRAVRIDPAIALRSE